MKSRNAAWTFGALALLASTPALADGVDDYVQAEMLKQHIPGLSLAVLRNGQPVKTAGYGIANVEWNLPARPETVYQVQSITKTFTAAAVMMLVEEGKIAPDDKLTAYLTAVPDCWNGITIRHLLTHTSGIKDFINEPTVDLRKDISPEEVIRSLAELPLNFAPGEKYAYSNTGYHLLGMIIHKITGKLWGDFLAERVFDPLQMSDTRVISLSEIIPNRASGYLWVNGRLQNGQFIAPSILGYAGGGLRSTVLDLAKWDAALYTEKLLKPGTLEQMWTPATLNDGTKTSYGFGWGVGEFRGQRMLSHSGSHMTGFKTAFLRFPGEKLTVIVLTNQRNADQVKIGREVAARYFDVGSD
jgi:D-alanyl-D-alanine carboxypeptidase